MSKQKIPVIDSDRLVYAAGFICETRNEGGTVDVAPLSHGLQIIKTAVNGILKVFNAKDSGDGFLMYLTGSNNFRIKTARIKPYKGNRKAAKPFWYKEMRKYLVDTYGAIVTDGYEADDAVTMAVCENENAVIVAQDKDYLQVPGEQYDPVRREWLRVSEHDAKLNFWTQVLVGDQIDNITGCPKIGPKKAPRILHGATTEKAMFMRCKEAYKNAYPNGCLTYDGVKLSAEEALRENCELLHLLRYEGDHWETRLK